MGAQAAGREFVRRVAPGVVLRQMVGPGPDGPEVVNVVDVDLQRPGVRVRAWLGRQQAGAPVRGRETASGLCARLGLAAAINGGFFDGSGCPVGLHVSGGELVREPYPGRAALGITQNGRVLFDTVTWSASVAVAGRTRSLAGLNHAGGRDDLIAYTRAYGHLAPVGPSGAALVVAGVNLPLHAGAFQGTVDVAAGSGYVAIPADGLVLAGRGAGAAFLRGARAGDPVTLRIALRTGSGASWDNVREAIGAGPFLVRNGQPAVDSAAEHFLPDVARARQPRTAVGATRTGHLLLATVDGRQNVSAGLYLANLARLMARLGAWNAINLDGGSSTSLSLRGLVVNSPSAGVERPVANLLGVEVSATNVPVAVGDGARPGSDSAGSLEVGDSLAGRPAAAADPSPTAVSGLVLAPETAAVAVGETVDFRLVPGSAGEDDDAGPSRPSPAVPGGSVPPFAFPPDLSSAAGIWGTEGGMGFVDQGGRFTGVRAGSAQVLYRQGGHIWRADVTVTATLPPGAPGPAPPAISTPDAGGPPDAPPAAGPNH